MIELGGNIVLKGFRDRDYAELIVVKKIVGRYARQITDHGTAFDMLEVSLEAHDKGAKPFEITVHLRATKKCSSKVADRNLYVALDSALKKIEQQLR